MLAIARAEVKCFMVCELNVEGMNESDRYTRTEGEMCPLNRKQLCGLRPEENVDTRSIQKRLASIFNWPCVALVSCC